MRSVPAIPIPTSCATASRGSPPRPAARATDVLAAYAKDAPIGRLIRPEEVAAAVLYLCSPDAAAVTGTTLAVAGGEM